MLNPKKIEQVHQVISEEPNLIKINNFKKIVFVGDTHGDLDVSQMVVEKYLTSENKIVFLGDYVDRGEKSKQNLNFLLKTKTKNPNNIYLLQGNHEGHHIMKFSPASFWNNLSNEEYKIYTSIVEKLPLVAVTDDIIALHGALPDVEKLEDINKINLGSPQWQQICWGDFMGEANKSPGKSFFTGRPEFNQDWFFNLIEKFKKQILIRSHQPTSPLLMFDQKCITIFTSSSYGIDRKIATADSSEEIKTARDLKIKNI